MPVNTLMEPMTGMRYDSGVAPLERPDAASSTKDDRRNQYIEVLGARCSAEHNWRWNNERCGGRCNMEDGHGGSHVCGKCNEGF
jgi:hypothetical protein